MSMTQQFTTFVNERCENNKSIYLETSNLSGVGRFLTLSTTVKSVCPNKNVALGIKVR